MTQRRTLLILGTRTFAVEVADLASDLPDVDVAGFVENMEADRVGSRLEGLPIHWVDDLASLAATHVAVCALSTTHRSRFIEQTMRHGVEFTTIVHPTARVSRTAQLGAGTIVSAGAMIGAHARLGLHVIVNRGALIGHHTTIGACSTLGPGINIGGGCELAEAVYVGIGAIVLDKMTVGRHSLVGAGALVTRPVPDRVQVMGVPARIVREGIEGK